MPASDPLHRPARRRAEGDPRTDAGLLPEASGPSVPPTAWQKFTRGLGARMKKRGWAAAGWLRANTFWPAWLPPRWRHPLAGYLAAVLVQGLAFLLTLLLATMFPTFSFLGTLSLFGIVVVALSFGAGPSLLAVLMSSVLLWIVVVPPQFNWNINNPVDGIALVLLACVGLVVSLIASRAEQARRAAEAALYQRDVFLSMASHELKTPLTAILGRVQVMARYLDRLGASAGTASSESGPDDNLTTRTRQMVVSIEQSTRRIASLVDQMLDVASIQAGSLTLRLATVDLAAVVREAVEEQRHQQSDRDIRLDLPDVPVMVVADAHRIGQVVTNYLTNALKYAPEDQPIEVALHIQGAGTHVTVRDFGPGLPPDEHVRVWEQYHQAPGIKVIHGSSVGLGLGLYISRMIVEAHPGGRVRVQSVVGHGSRFWFTLPLAPRPEQH